MKKLSILFVIFFSVSLLGQSNELISNVKHQFWGQVQYVNSETTGDVQTFQMKRFRIGAKGDMLKNLKFAFLFEMANNPFLLQGWLDYVIRPEVNIRIGMFKYPFGIENYTSATVWDLINPSYVSSGITYKLGSEGGKLRDIGLQASGKFSLGEKAGLTYYAMLMNGNGINTKDNNKQKDIVGRVKFNFDKMLQIGASYFTGTTDVPNTTTQVNENAFGVDVIFNSKIANRRLKVQGEYITATYEVVGGEVKPGGFYAHALYCLIPATLEAVVRYDSYSNDTNTDLKKNRTTLGVAYYLAKKQRISANYELISDDYNVNTGNLFTLQFQYALQ
ncbi:MAG: hypothetical protein SCALA702_05320 [Melioribacteraceae bacterium]|nr:MAG: hypothetical protein SCALA702_05320 [Melioribacteraceae bacterium]